MRGRSADGRRAVAGSLLLHAVPIAFALLELWWVGGSRVRGADGQRIEADLVDVNALSAAMQRAMTVSAQPPPPPPPSELETVKVEEAHELPEVAPPQDLPDPDDRPMAANPVDRETAARELEPRPINDGPLSDASETSQGAVNESDTVSRGARSSELDLAARYRAALDDAIKKNWSRPAWMPANMRCKLTINQTPGGAVTEVHVDPSCPYDELDRRSLEAAVLQAQPLPYAGFEPVFQQVLILDFEAQGP